MNEENFERNKNRIIRTLAASKNCDFYNNRLKKFKLNVLMSYENFCEIPITKKEDYKEKKFEFINNDIYEKGFSIKKYISINNDILVADEYLKRFDLKLRTTSGSTGNPMDIFVHKEDLLNAYFNLNRKRNIWFPFFYKEKYIWIWYNNQLHYRFKNQKGALDKNYGYQYFISEANESELYDVFHFIMNNKIKWMVCSASFIYAYSIFLKNQHLTDTTLEYVECQSEKLFEWQLDNVKKYLKAKVSNVYSSNEIHFMGITCSNNIMHTISDNAFIEIINNEVIVTNLSALYMPLIRYNIGDIAYWLDGKCKCENQKEACFELTGFRTNDNIVLRNGKKISYFIISESITNLRHTLNIDFEQYSVCQEKYNVFNYQIFSDKNYREIENKKIIIKKYLSDYLRKIIGCEIIVNIKVTKFPIYNSKQKYKYFYSKL